VRRLKNEHPAASKASASAAMAITDLRMEKRYCNRAV
jgi:hypothetical protein